MILLQLSLEILLYWSKSLYFLFGKFVLPFLLLEKRDKPQETLKGKNGEEKR